MNIALSFLCIIDWYLNKKYIFRNRYMSIWSRICIPVYKKVCQGSLSRNISILLFQK